PDPSACTPRRLAPPAPASGTARDWYFRPGPGRLPRPSRPGRGRRPAPPGRRRGLFGAGGPATGTRRDDPRLAVHRPARVGALGGGAGLRRRAAVRRG